MKDTTRQLYSFTEFVYIDRVFNRKSNQVHKFSRYYLNLQLINIIGFNCFLLNVCKVKGFFFTLTLITTAMHTDTVALSRLPFSPHHRLNYPCLILTYVQKDKLFNAHINLL